MAKTPAPTPMPAFAPVLRPLLCWLMPDNGVDVAALGLLPLACPTPGASVPVIDGSEVPDITLAVVGIAVGVL